MTGDPLFADGVGEVLPRDRIVEGLCRALSNGPFTALRTCRGSFCIAHYEPESGRLLLATDLCGVRPLFFHLGSDYVFFATALHLLSDVEGVPKGMDVLGTGELAAHGFPLSDRTTRAAVKVLRGSETLRCEVGKAERSAYFAWSEVAVSDAPLESLLDEAYARFIEAVRLRSQRDDDALAFLSGGLDSRCVSAALTVLGKRVTTLNFLRPGFKDTSLADRFAEAMGTRHLTQQVPTGESQWVSKGLAASRIDWQGHPPSAHPRVCFTGDGGSVGIGHVYVESAHMDAVRQHDAAALLRHARAPRPVRLLFRESIFRDLADAMARAVEAEIEEAGGVRTERGYYLYLMNNDQRRHLHHHFENIDRYRAEFMTPFYDAEFVLLMVSIPIEPCLYHRFYYDWMKRFPAAVSEIPWQAYPGHLPCPVDSDADAADSRSQWDRTAAERRDASREVFRESTRTFLRSLFSRFPSELLRRSGCAAALLAHGLRLRQCEGILRTYLTFQAHCDENEGRVQLPEASG